MTDGAATETVLVLGATSGIGRELAAFCASRGSDLALAGRDVESLEAIAEDCALRYGVETRTTALAALEFDDHDRVVEACFAETPPLLSFLCIGYMGDLGESRRDFREARVVLDTNLTACVSLVDRLVSRLESSGAGAVGVISSVAGDRGRKSNYYYAAAKSGLSTYLEGLRARLRDSPITVTDIRLGPVDTRMTYGHGAPLATSPANVAPTIVRAVQGGRRIVYVPGYWRAIMWGVRALPESFLARLPI